MRLIFLGVSILLFSCVTSDEYVLPYIPMVECDTYCGTQARLDLALDLCAEIDSSKDERHCKNAATEGYKTCRSRCK